ncbi:MAG TPA: GGDEF domain-containing protein [Rhizobiaceae bacterium]|nr:GGDEF domain-containing protein [Rhizobiaceae bacterium]
MLNAFLLLCEAALYFSVMVGLFRLRKTIGIGVFLCALGAMHFLETYLAGVFYVATPVGMLSPGSTVLFSGKLVMLLLLYIKEDAITVRQPLYGLLIGNALIVALVLILRFHDIAALPAASTPDIGFLDDMGWLMVWGTALLYVDAILIILLYERLGRVFRNALLARIAISVACVLTFDQIGFFTVLHFVADAPVEVFLGGWAGKLAAALAYSLLLAAYLKWFEREALPSPRGLADIFQMLTYRERYEALVERANRDGLTGLLHRGRFDKLGARAVETSLQHGTPLTLLIVDVDHFKSINDELGHSEGDRVLRAVAELLERTVGADDQVFRIGGEEFAVLCARPHALGRLLGEQIRQAMSAAFAKRAKPITVSVGLASVNDWTQTLGDLFAIADRRLYVAKETGRDRVVGEVTGDRRKEAHTA